MAEVESLGTDVKDFKIGEKVGFGTLRACCDNCVSCKKGKENLCTDQTIERFTYMGTHWGGFSTHIQQPAAFFFKLPEGLKEELAAPLLCAGITVYSPLKKYLKEGDKVAVLGIGGLGHLAVQFAAKRGHHVTAVTSSLDKKDLIMGLGAKEVLVMSDEKSYKEHCGKYNIVINTLPSAKNFNDYIKLCAPEAHFVQVGAPEASEALTLNPVPLIMGEINIVGGSVGNRADTVEMLNECVKHDIYPMVEEYDFENFDKGFDRLEHGKPKFRVVVKVKDFANERFKK